jgi:hypothetical protein
MSSLAGVSQERLDAPSSSAHSNEREYSSVALHKVEHAQRSERTHLDRHVSQPSFERGRRVEVFETAENVTFCDRDLRLPSLAVALVGAILHYSRDQS